VRLHGRNPQHWEAEFGRPARAVAANDYLYTRKELLEWKARIDQIQQHAANTFVFANNDAGGKAVVNALQLSAMLGDDRRLASAQLIEHFPAELSGFRSEVPVQDALFAHYDEQRVA